MAVQNDDTIVTKGDLKNLYADKIAPYLGANMQLQVGASDYYSTDEKIVGVWTDGRPIYQRTFIVTNVSISANTISNVELGTGAENCELVSSFGSRSKEEPIPYSWYSLQMMGVIDRTAGKFILCAYRSGSAFTIPEISMTYQYTKTTDTANSATTTVGCYDPTRPDQWLENTEIYFGNGLYGYRATGTMNMSKQAHNNVNCGVTATKFVNQGGHWMTNSSYDYPFGCTWSGNGSSTIAWIDRADSNQLKLAFWPDTNLTNATYDVWVLYRK